MRMLFILVVNFLIGTVNVYASTNYSNEIAISSPIAVSETGRFEIDDHSPLVIDKSASTNLTNFVAYREANTGNPIIIGAIFGDVSLDSICKQPTFLKDERIADISTVDVSDIHYLKIDKYQGCIIDYDKQKSAMIIAVPAPFVSQDGNKIKYVGVVGNRNNIDAMKFSVSFQVTASDFYINLVQLAQAFSPFSNKINWDDIKGQITYLPLFRILQ